MDALSHCLRKQKKPSFFKILIKDFSTRLQIPPAFMKKFGKQIPNKTMLEDYNEKYWEVEVEKLGENFCFSKGWEKFVEDNNLEHGDFLVFKYFADSKFKVTIYGRTCCEKQLPVARERNYEPPNGKDKEDHRKVKDQGKRKWVGVDDDFNEDEELKGARRNNCEFNRAKACEGDAILIDSDSSDDEKTGVLKQTTCKRRTKAHTIEDNKAFKRNGKCNTLSPDEQIKFNSQYPFFQVKLNFSNIKGGYLYIPKTFRKYMMRKKEQEVKFQISKEFWSLGLQFIRERRNNAMGEIRICKGWRLFVKKTDLKLGDVCIFEMITGDDDDVVIFSVHVHRWDVEEAQFVKIFQ